MLAIIIIILIVAWLVTRLYVLIDWLSLGWFSNLFKPKINESNWTMDYIDIDSEPEIIIPYYINDEINAIYDQLETYNKLIDYYTNELPYINNPEKVLKQKKKISDLKYKCSKLENKVNKLLDQYEK